MRIIVAYDVADDNRRAKLSAYLSSWGARLQRSVFECSIDDGVLGEFQAEIERRIRLDDDVVHIFRQCAPCHDSRIELGQPLESPGTFYWIV